eukprot:1334758-Amphidinium_carterae.1
MPVIIRLNGCFLDLLRSAHSTTAAAFANSTVPYMRVLDAAKVGRVAYTTRTQNKYHDYVANRQCESILDSLPAAVRLGALSFSRWFVVFVSFLHQVWTNQKGLTLTDSFVELDMAYKRSNSLALSSASLVSCYSPNKNYYGRYFLKNYGFN